MKSHNATLAQVAIFYINIFTQSRKKLNTRNSNWYTVLFCVLKTKLYIHAAGEVDRYSI